MKAIFKKSIQKYLLVLMLVPFVSCAQKPAHINQSRTFTNMMETSAKHTNTLKTDTATFAAGCFWCVEEQFKQLEGVLSVTSGFTGGSVANPGYKEVCTGTTGHAEACNIVYDPSKISFDQLLAAFFVAHDPTQLNRQGNDVGTQYRSAVFYHTAEQKKLADYYIRKLNEEKVYPSPIVTEVSPYHIFYKAEDYHQNYYERNSEQPYCKFVIKPKSDKFKQIFKDKLKMENQHSGNPYYSRTDTSPLHVSNAEWKKILQPDLYAVAREQNTERAFTGKYWKNNPKGTYYCAVCGNKLFRSDAKFSSSCGWPSFYETVRPNSVLYKPDNSYGMQRTEVECGRCNSHLGHIFDDGPAPTYKRFCMNSVSLDFEPDTH